MSRFTERLLQVALLLVILQFGWGLMQLFVLAPIRAVQLERRLQQAEEALQRRPFPAPPPAASDAPSSSRHQ